MPFDLIIWDCDGCLIDSEAIACGVTAQELTALGYPITERTFVDRFAGHTNDHTLRVIFEETGKDLSLVFDHFAVRKKVLAVFEERLQPTSYVREAVSAIPLPRCIASGSSLERNMRALQLTNLFDLFEGRLFSSNQVARSKPAPDIFLYAAEQMGIEPSRCLVIEDSVAGVTAARAADMRVFAYMGGSHVTASWRARVAAQNPDILFDDMRVLPEMVSNGFSSSSSRTSGSP